MPDPELKRVLKLPAVVCIAIGFTIGGGVFVFTGVVFKIVGQALPIASSPAVLPVFISMMPIAMLGSAIPTTGGNYRYPSRMVSPGLAFVGVWVFALASFLGQIPLYALGCAKYLQVYPSNLSPTLNGLFMVGTKSLLMIVQDKLLPEWLGYLNRRFGTPHVFLTIIWVRFKPAPKVELKN